MNIHEHQAKALLAGFGVAVPRGKPAFSVDEAVAAARGTIELAPDNLEAHVILAAAQAASGRAAEARETRQEIVRIKTDFAVDDFARTQPFKDPSVLAGLVADLREAGLS